MGHSDPQPNFKHQQPNQDKSTLTFYANNNEVSRAPKDDNSTSQRSTFGDIINIKNESKDIQRELVANDIESRGLEVGGHMGRSLIS